VLRSTLVPGAPDPGTLLDDHLTVACTDGAVRLRQLQRAGKRAMAAEDFQRGAAIARGMRLT
jgi:methionyl-tRNA formyltransferase